MKKFHWFMEPDAAMETMTFWQKWKYFITARRAYAKAGKWHFLATPRMMAYIIFFVGIQQLFDMSHFFNKFNLNIPTESWILKWRIIVVALSFVGIGNEFYYHMCERKGSSMPWSLFIGLSTCIIEVLLYFKFVDWAAYEMSIPWGVKLPWFILIGVLLLVFVLLCVERIVDEFTGFYSDLDDSEKREEELEKLVFVKK
jgi:hypothetical protein